MLGKVRDFFKKHQERIIVDVVAGLILLIFLEVASMIKDKVTEYPDIWSNYWPYIILWLIFFVFIYWNHKRPIFFDGNMIVKDPAAKLDYKFDWNSVDAPWLTTGETISSFTVTVPNGLTLDTPEPSQAEGIVTYWLSGGTAGQIYLVVCQIITNLDRIDKRTM